MNPVVKAGVILAVAVAVVQLVVAGAGLHENPMVAGLVTIVVFIALNIGAVVWALRQTAADSGYGKQLMNGAVIGLVAGVLILVFSFVMLSYIFPDYLQESRDAVASMLEGSQLPEEQINAQIAKLDQATPIGQAFQGFVGTFLTSVIVAAIAAIFLRKK